MESRTAPTTGAPGRHRGESSPKKRSLARKYSIFTSLLLSYVVFVVVAHDVWAHRFDAAKSTALVIMTAVVAGAIAKYTNHLLARPLLYLQEGITAVREGRLEPIRVSRTGDEIEYVGESFNAMIADLADSRAKLEQYKTSLEELVRQRTRALEEVSHKALAASQAKSEFLANMSHELRTPMSGVLGMIDIVLDSALEADQREHLLTAKECANALLTLLNDILDLSKIEAGKMDIERVPIELPGLMRECVKALHVRAAQKGIELRTKISPGLPALIAGDPLRLRQILLNLISNAVKFTERGYVEVRASVGSASGDGDHDPELFIDVADTGPGIPAGKLSAIFEQFTQADGSISRRYGGTGLGLAITRRLVEMQGGSIAVESVENRGSTFRVRLPMQPIEEPARMAAGARSDADKLRAVPLARCSTVLVVEDNPVNHKVVAAILRKHGYRITTAAHGGEVIPALERDPAAIVLMDVQMPEVDGIEATRRLRSHPRWRDIPVIAMTAHAMNGDRERCIQAGMSAYVSKPINRARLIATIERLLGDDAGDWRSPLGEASGDLGRPAEKERQRRTWEADREAGASFAEFAR